MDHLDTLQPTVDYSPHLHARTCEFAYLGVGPRENFCLRKQPKFEKTKKKKNEDECEDVPGQAARRWQYDDRLLFTWRMRSADWRRLPAAHLSPT